MKTYFHLPAKFLLIGLLFHLAPIAQSQVSMQINLPRVLEPNTAYSFEVRVITNGATGFTGYEMQVSPGLKVSMPDKFGGRFSFSNNSAKLVSRQLSTSEQPKFALSLYSGAPGTYTILQRLFVEKDPANRDHEVQPFIIRVGGEEIAGSRTAGFTTLEHYNSTSQAFNMPIVFYSDPEQLRAHLLQQYQDSKEISKVGEAEYKKAAETAEDATIIMGQAEHITEEAVQTKVLKLATYAKEKAQTDMELAGKIIQLGKSLEVNPGPYHNYSAPTVLPEGHLAGNSEILPLVSREGSDNYYEGTVYRIQVGAFKKRAPRKASYSSLGKVDIVKENGFYKVLIDNFRSKQEAFSKRELILSRGYDAFVATYQDGVREL